MAEMVWIDSSASSSTAIVTQGCDHEELKVWFGAKGLAAVGFNGFCEREKELRFGWRSFFCLVNFFFF